MTTRVSATRRISSSMYLAVARTKGFSMFVSSTTTLSVGSITGRLPRPGKSILVTVPCVLSVMTQTKKRSGDLQKWMPTTFRHGAMEELQMKATAKCSAEHITGQRETNNHINSSSSCRERVFLDKYFFYILTLTSLLSCRTTPCLGRRVLWLKLGLWSCACRL